MQKPAWLWISYVDPLLCVTDSLSLLWASSWVQPDCCYSVSAWLWISSVDLSCVCLTAALNLLGDVTLGLFCEPPLVCSWPDQCGYNVCLALDVICEPVVCAFLTAATVSTGWTCAWLLLLCLRDSGSPGLTSSCVWLTATTLSAWLWISSVKPLLYVSDCCRSEPSCICLGLNLCWLLPPLPFSFHAFLTAATMWLTLD